MVHNDWFPVYSDNKPSFKKPPLQYWITAVALRNFADINFAARLSSYMFGLGLLIATGVLANLIYPNNQYAAPTAIIILSVSTAFWQLAISAFLDTGMVFFSTVAVIGTILAVRKPKYWYLVAAAVGAGALQKAPVAALLVATILVLVPLRKRYHDISIAKVITSRHFLFACLLSVSIMAFWPLLQTAMYGPKTMQQQYVDEMLQRFNPMKSDNNSQRWYLISWKMRVLFGSQAY